MGFAVVNTNGRIGTALLDRGERGPYELGHALGLGHVGDPVQIIYPTIGANNNTPAAYQPGDLAALASAIDRGPCT